MTIVGRTIKDGVVISIIRKYLVSGIMIDDEYEDSIVGTPQGGLCRDRCYAEIRPVFLLRINLCFYFLKSIMPSSESKNTDKS